MNRYSFARDHGIAMHHDASQAYDACDPIASLSMVLGSFLLVSAKQKRKRGGKDRWCLVVYQPPNSMLIMGGNFQTEFTHGVPSFGAIQRLVKCVEGEVTAWMVEQEPIRILWARNAKERMEAELQRLESVGLTNFKNARWNVTLRWCRNHFGSNCPLVPRRADEEMPFGVGGSEPSAPSAASARSAPPALAWDQKASKESARQWSEISKASLRSAESEISKPSLRSAESEISKSEISKAEDKPAPITPPEASSRLASPSPVDDLLMMLKGLFELSEGSQRGASLFTGCSTVRILF